MALEDLIHDFNQKVQSGLGGKILRVTTSGSSACSMHNVDPGVFCAAPRYDSQNEVTGTFAGTCGYDTDITGVKGPFEPRRCPERGLEKTASLNGNFWLKEYPYETPSAGLVRVANPFRVIGGIAVPQINIELS